MSDDDGSEPMGDVLYGILSEEGAEPTEDIREMRDSCQ